MSLGLDALIALATAPLLLRFLGAPATGVWMLFLSMAALLSSLQMGMGPTLTRRAAALPREDKSWPVAGAWAGLRRAALTVYGGICILIVVSAILVWETYLSRVCTPQIIVYGGLFWMLFVSGLAARLLAQFNFYFLNGLGIVGIDKAATTLIGLGNLMLLTSLTIWWGNLAAPVCAYFLSGVSLYLASRYLLRKNAPWSAKKTEMHVVKVTGLLDEGYKMLILNLTGYVTTQGCLVLLEKSNGTEAVAVFAPVLRVVLLLTTAASLAINMSYPYMATAWSEGKPEVVRRYATRGLLIGVVSYSLAVLPLLVAPRAIITRWLGETHYIGDGTVRLIVCYGFLYVLHLAAATPVIAGRKADFVAVAIANMILVIAAMLWLSRSLDGLVGFPAGMLLGTIGPSLVVIFISRRCMQGSGKTQ